jgi:hypothetical protein
MAWLLAASCWPSCRADELATVRLFLDTYCVACHQGESAAADLDWDSLDVASLLVPSQPPTASAARAVWEKGVKRLRTRQMPPLDATRPPEAETQAILHILETALDAAARHHPQPGRTESLRRLSRTEYRNAIRDLLALDVDVESLLPVDQESHGFDNVTVGDLSPSLLSRYITAAQQISRIAVGAPRNRLSGVHFRLRPDQSQRAHVDGLPLGTRGGGLFHHTFAESGEYEFQVRLTRDRDEHIEGLNGTHEIDLLLDRKLIQRFTVVAPPRADDGYGRDDTKSDAHLKTRAYVTAGPHAVGATFPRQGASLLEIKRQPFDASFNRHRHPRPEPAIFELAVTGPLETAAVEPIASTVGNDPRTPSQQRLLIDRPRNPDDHEQALQIAKNILHDVTRRAYRGPVNSADLQTPLKFFRQAWTKHGFDAGIESALAAVLVSPKFLFRVEADPAGVSPGEVYRVSDLELASRLSFFLWSSVPDDPLLTLAAADRLHEPAELRRQVQRMLGDDRAQSLSTNFADQWLYLRNLESFAPDLRLFPDFDDNLRQAFRRETQLLFECIQREDRSVLDLLRADFSYLNERLAKHYGIVGVHGSHFRKVSLGEKTRRGGLLRQGSILAVSSYATRTSPTIRGNWVLKNLLGTAVPPPPPDVPPLAEKTTLADVPIRERLAAHRANPACASCHDLIDPIGFALENYDAVGRWREFDGEDKIDAQGMLPDGTKISGVGDLQAGLLKRPEMFVGTLTEKLLIYALGRGIEPGDGPAVRKIVRQSAEEDYRLSALVWRVVESVPFLMRTAE